MADMVVAAGIDAARDFQLELADVALPLQREAAPAKSPARRESSALASEQ